MTIAFCCTRNWYIHLYTIIYALLKHNKIDKIYLFIEDDEISYLKNDKIEFINVNRISEYITSDSPNYNTKYTKLSYLRCFFSKILNEDKILYLDVDTLVVDNINELWNLDLKDNVIAGVHEDGEWNRHLNTYGLNDTYINSGVLLMGLKKIREEKLDDSMIYLLNNNKYAFPDQDVINLVCRNRIHHLSNIYNSSETTGIVDNAKIIHYIRGNKGWIKSSPRSDTWLKYHLEMLGDDNMYKVKALINFDDVKVQDENGNNVKRVANVSEWEVDKDRYLFLKEHNAVELIEVIPETITKENVAEKITEIKESAKEEVKTATKKTTKKKKSDSND